MSSKLDKYKDVIDSLDSDLFGDNWIINGHHGIRGIFDEVIDEFENINQPRYILLIDKCDVPVDLEEDNIVVNQDDFNRRYVYTQTGNTIDGKVELYLRDE